MEEPASKTAGSALTGGNGAMVAVIAPRPAARASGHRHSSTASAAKAPLRTALGLGGGRRDARPPVRPGEREERSPAHSPCAPGAPARGAGG